MYLQDVVEKIEKETGVKGFRDSFHIGLDGEKSVIFSQYDRTFEETEDVNIDEVSIEDFPFTIHTLLKHNQYHNYVFCENLNQAGVLNYLIGLHLQEDDLEEFAVYFKGQRITYYLYLNSIKHNGGISMVSSGYIRKGVVQDRDVINQEPNLVFVDYVLKNLMEETDKGKIRDLRVKPLDFDVDGYGLNGVLRVVEFKEDVLNHTDIEGKPTFFLRVYEVGEFITEQYKKNPDIKLAVIACETVMELKFENDKIIWPIDLGKYFKSIIN